MYDGAVNKKSGILVINLPGTSDLGIAPRPREKELVYPDVTSDHWTTVASREEYELLYPYMPARIIDNLLNSQVRISVVPWGRIADFPDRLRYLVDVTFKYRGQCLYDLSRPMRLRNSSD